MARMDEQEVKSRLRAAFVGKVITAIDVIVDEDFGVSIVGVTLDNKEHWTVAAFGHSVVWEKSA
jgi:hypothetical protein